ncbi:hypothetical protein FBEOM_6825 [Fusarium beomiforme]|uniref:F-box domain-containing protein n=1 Tax=Fusarium beomiforme TaxID=44412 RepID=A0A9P5AIV2_9HYPO|nr:hypothetical protein FBEOM_6825 [Fusarium beomiforme]
MAPLSLLDCPQEVQLSIAELPHSDLANLSMSCRALHRIAEPLVYSLVRFMWIRKSYPPITKMLHLLRTLLAKPNLRPLVRNADFEGYGFITKRRNPPTVIPALPASQLYAAIKRTGVSQLVADDWKNKVQSGSPEATVAVLISLLPNLERLCLYPGWTHDTEYLGAMLRAALCDRPQHKEQTDLPSFLSLKHVSLTLMTDEERILDPRNTADALALFYLPNIETLSVSIDNPTNFFWPSSSPPSPTSLKSLEVFRLRESRLAPILSTTANLNKFQYNWLYRPDIDYEVSKEVVMLDTMAEALLQVKDSLEELAITAETFPSFSQGLYEPPDVIFRGSLIKLCDMDKLKTLRVPWSFLIGRYGFSSPGHLGAAIPPNLEHLALGGELMLSGDDDPEDCSDELMVEAFEKELESGALSHVKTLKSVCLPGSMYADGMPEACEEKMRVLEARFGLSLSYDRYDNVEY